ncbi:MAG: hypothetical protein WAS36_04135, partial [Candidatus Saccharimonadales bacterium]
MNKSVPRLYTQFQSNHYDLRLALDETKQMFYGTVTITGKKVNRPSKRLTFHANGIRITNASITYHGKKESVSVDIARINHQKSFHEVRLHTEAQLFPGDYEVVMEFQAPISAAMTGIYPSHYKDNGKDKTMYATQFESHHAREAFPCIDEPEAKATFALTMLTEASHVVLSNMPVATELSADESNPLAAKVTSKSPLKVTTFETSPKM